MEINRYLKDLGLTWYDLPGNYISKASIKIRLKRRWYKIKRGFCFMFSSLEDRAPDYNEKYEYCAYDKANKKDKEGFCKYEFYSLDYSLALYIYPRLCKFRDEYAKYGTPGCLCYDENEKQLPSEESSKRWIEILDKMIWSFKSIIIEPTWNTPEELQEINAKIDEGLHLFADYFQCLWW